MKVLHLASFDHWTGAAAPAFSEVEGLRSVGVDAHYAFAGGGGLERKLGALPFTHAAISREQGPLAIRKATRTLRALVERERFDLVHAHLTHDHWLARLALRPLRGVTLVRTFHSRRPLRRDPVTSWLLTGTTGVAVNNAEFVSDPAVRHFRPLFTPPPVDERILRPGPDARSLYGIPPETPLLGFIGKVDKGRGFEEAIHTYALVRKERSEARLLIIGRGPHRPALEELSAELGVSEGVIWAGYHEDDLAEHLRAPDLMLFTARGSDEGHRAIIESMACGTAVAAFPLEGVKALYGPLAGRLVAPRVEADALAAVCAAFLRGELGISPDDCVAATEPSRYGPTGRRLESWYRSLSPGARPAPG